MKDMQLSLIAVEEEDDSVHVWRPEDTEQSLYLGKDEAKVLAHWLRQWTDPERSRYSTDLQLDWREEEET